MWKTRVKRSEKEKEKAEKIRTLYFEVFLKLPGFLPLLLCLRSNPPNNTVPRKPSVSSLSKVSSSGSLDSQCPPLITKACNGLNLLVCLSNSL